MLCLICTSLKTDTISSFFLRNLKKIFMKRIGFLTKRKALKQSVRKSEQYQKCLKEALENLAKVNRSMFDSLVQIETQGELKEWVSSVLIGEIHQFDVELFRNSGDTNVHLFVKLIESVEGTYQSIKNINGLVISG